MMQPFDPRLMQLRRLMLAGSLEVFESDRVLDRATCQEMLRAVSRAPEDVDHRHIPLETLDGSSFLGTASMLVDRLREVSAHHAELRLQRAFCIRYVQDEGHAAHVDPCAFTIKYALVLPSPRAQLK